VSAHCYFHSHAWASARRSPPGLTASLEYYLMKLELQTDISFFNQFGFKSELIPLNGSSFSLDKALERKLL